MGSPTTLSHLILKGQFQGHSDFEGLYIVSLKTDELSRMLLLDIIGNHIWNAPLELTLSDFEMSKLKSLIVYHRGADLGYMLLLNTKIGNHI